MLANRLISWSTGRQAARLRLLAEGVPRRGGEAAEAVRRDAPVPAGDREREGRHDRGSASSTTARGGHGTSKYGISRTIRVVLDLLTVKFLLSYATTPAADLRARRVGVWASPASLIRAWLAYLRLFGTRRSRNRPLLLFGMLLIFIGRAARHAGPARRAAGAHLPRVAEQADLRHPGDPASRVQSRRIDLNQRQPHSRCTSQRLFSTKARRREDTKKENALSFPSRSSRLRGKSRRPVQLDSGCR